MSRKANTVKSEISCLISQLIQSKLCIGQQFPSVKNIGGKFCVGVLNNRSKFFFKDHTSEVIYEDIISSQSFSLILIDGAIIQFLYTFDKEQVFSHRLLYLPKPMSLAIQEDRDLQLLKNKPLIRIDFTDEGNEEFNHSITHMHLDNYEDCRIPVSAPVGPRAFMYFILRNFYRSESENFFNNHKRDLGTSFSATITDNESEEMHIGLNTE